MDDQAKEREHLLLLFERPKEPVFMPKGENETVFDIPDKYWVDHYKPLQASLSNKFGGESVQRVKIEEIKIPDLTLPMSLGRQENFSLFIRLHQKMANDLIHAFMAPKTLKELVSLSAFAKDRINPYLYNYALSVAILHRSDTRNLPLPTTAEVFPDKYVDSRVLSRAMEQATVIPAEILNVERMPIEIPQDYTASDLDEEHRVAYFREDLGLNLHHWHWHLVYPSTGPMNIVNKDRRGELFYYMHQQIMARYNFERLCNNLSRTKRLLNLRDPIPEGYFPKLDSLVSSRVWPGRPPNTKLSDINREMDQLRFDIEDMERWKDRFYSAIHKGKVVNAKGEVIDLTEENGINLLGNMMESSPVLSINRFFYGDLHNSGHLLLGLAHDPDHRYLETYGVIGDPATSMRDPAFYRWHAFVDDIFQEHKNLLPRYTEDVLRFNRVRLTSVDMIGKGKPNELCTYWQKSDVNLSRGMDFTPRGNVFARFTHLQHDPFYYKIEVENSGEARLGTCRIFLSPKFDERGQPFLFRDQKLMFIEMDRFTLWLKSGTQPINRRSKESSVIIPFEQTFRDLQANRPASGSSGEDEFNFCGCGWPEHLLLPKGNAAGMVCQLFVMISDYQGDKVDNPTSGPYKVNASSYCGLRDKKYPDKRAMGFPFDRMPRDGVNTLQEFLTPNMAVTDITITFKANCPPKNSMNSGFCDSTSACKPDECSNVEN